MVRCFFFVLLVAAAGVAPVAAQKGLAPTTPAAGGKEFSVPRWNAQLPAEPRPAGNGGAAPNKLGPGPFSFLPSAPDASPEEGFSSLRDLARGGWDVPVLTSLFGVHASYKGLGHGAAAGAPRDMFADPRAPKDHGGAGLYLRF